MTDLNEFFDELHSEGLIGDRSWVNVVFRKERIDEIEAMLDEYDAYLDIEEEFGVRGDDGEPIWKVDGYIEFLVE